ncbi:hypothetical protein F5876DRAFT_82121 [Lentinula aff. lateritia]|uniref:Uncharacterized protein n=1 Tax=Lentinula aff. lateritia TaxID=2804960 RepID=A0ACC1TKA3_9AGAR|nr:hypothetical protein F5876DRAFT_82121 [Lentinula aff. lateritia]
MSSPHTLDCSHLLSCRNSVLSPTKCQAYCGMFTPEEGNVGAITALTKCVVCGCYAASHLHPVQECNSAQNVESKPENSEHQSSFSSIRIFALKKIDCNAQFFSMVQDASTQPSGSFPESKKSQLPFSKDAKPFPSDSATASRIFESHTDSKIAAENFSASPFRDHPLQKLQVKCVLNGGRGTLAALQPSPLTVFTVKDLEIPKGIPAKTYPNFLYISLPTGSEDLDSLNTEGDVKTDGSSRKSKSKARSKARQVDTESDKESVQGDNRFPEASAPALMYHDVSMSSF